MTWEVEDLKPGLVVNIDGEDCILVKQAASDNSQDQECWYIVTADCTLSVTFSLDEMVNHLNVHGVVPSFLNRWGENVLAR